MILFWAFSWLLKSNWTKFWDSLFVFLSFSVPCQIHNCWPRLIQMELCFNLGEWLRVLIVPNPLLFMFCCFFWFCSPPFLCCFFLALWLCPYKSECLFASSRFLWRVFGLWLVFYYPSILRFLPLEVAVLLLTCLSEEMDYILHWQQKQMVKHQIKKTNANSGKGGSVFLVGYEWRFN